MPELGETGTERRSNACDRECDCACVTGELLASKRTLMRVVNAIRHHSASAVDADAGMMRIMMMMGKSLVTITDNI